MPRVVGVDWSLSKTGIGTIMKRADGSTLASAGKVDHPWPSTKVARAKAGLPEAIPLPERRERFVTAARDVLHYALGAELVVIESLVMAGPGRNADLIAGWWAVVGPLVREGVPVAEVAASSMKKAIADSGKADKATVSVAMVKLWPDLEIGSDDVGDAAGLAHIGAVALGWEVPTLARHREVKWTTWPAPAPIASDAA